MTIKTAGTVTITATGMIFEGFHLEGLEGDVYTRALIEISEWAKQRLDDEVNKALSGQTHIEVTR